MATTTVRGIVRQATLTEAANGVTTGSVPAFITPEELVSAGGGNLLVGNSAGAAPFNSVGTNGLYFFDQTAPGAIYGPKAGGTWPGTPVWRGYSPNVVLPYAVVTLDPQETYDFQSNDPALAGYYTSVVVHGSSLSACYLR